MYTYQVVGVLMSRLIWRNSVLMKSNELFLAIFFRSFYVLLLFSYATYVFCSNREIDIENDTSYPMHILINTHDLKLEHLVPCNAHSKITAKVVPISKLQNELFLAIVNNSVTQMCDVIRAGANVNAEIKGKKPLEWAMLLGNNIAIQCLVEHGATL